MAFPTTLYTATAPVDPQTLDSPAHDTLHSDAIDEVVAIEAKMGVNSSAVTTTHDYKLSGVTGTDKAVSKTGTETLTSKTLTSPILGGTPVLDYNSVVPFYTDGLYRQGIINGDFSVWQLGTTITDPTVANYTGPDCWDIFRTAFTAGLTITQVAPGIDGSQWACRVQRTAANASTQPIAMSHSIETKDTKRYRGKVCTFSAYVRVGANFSGASLSMRVTTSTVVDRSAVSETGTVIGTVTIPADTTDRTFFAFSTTAVGATANTIFCRFDYTPAGTAGDDDWFEVEQAQFSGTDVYLPFYSRPYQQELALCQRRMYIITTAVAGEAIAMGVARSTTAGRHYLTLPVEMRIVPSMIVTAADYRLDDFINAPVDCNAVSIGSESSTKVIHINTGVAAGLEQYRPYGFTGDATTGRKFILYANLV